MNNRIRFYRERLSPLARWLDYAVAVGLGLVFALPALLLGGFQPEPMVWVSGLVALLLVLHVICYSLRARGELRLNLAGLLVVPFLLYALFHTLVWSPVPWLAEKELLKYTLGAAVFWLALHHLGSRTRIWIFFTFFLLAAFLSNLTGLYQIAKEPLWLPLGRLQAEGYPPRISGTFGVPNHFAHLVAGAVLIGLVFMLVPRLRLPGRIVMGYVAAACFIGLVLSGSRGGWLSFLGALALLPVLLWERSRSRLIAWGSVLTVGIVTFVILFAQVPLVEDRVDQFLNDRGERSRLWMWEGSWDMWKDAPVFGKGAASYNYVFEQYRPGDWQSRPFYTHNDYLNILSDYGLVGFLLFFGPAAWLFCRGLRRWHGVDFRIITRRTGEEVMPAAKVMLAAVLLVLTAFGLHLVVDFHLAGPAFVFEAAALLGILGAVSMPAREVPLDRPHGLKLRGASLAVITLLAVLLTAWGANLYRAEVAYKRGFEALHAWFSDFDSPHDAAQARSILDDFEGALDLKPGHAEAWSDLGFARLYTAEVLGEPLAEAAPLALRETARAVEIAPEVWRFHLQHAAALRAAGEPFSKIDRAYRRALELAPNRASAWYYYADFLAGYPHLREKALEAVSQAQKLDWNHHRARALANKLKR